MNYLCDTENGNYVIKINKFFIYCIRHFQSNICELNNGDKEK